MKRCELCRQLAQIYCQSDNASLCYDCDQTVHSANFLVAKHSRTLLCHTCQAPTPWTASGLNIGRAASVCISCSSQQRPLQGAETSPWRNDVVEEYSDDDDEDDDDDDDEDDEEEEEEDEDDAENQVVPWSSVVSPPITSGCSSSSEIDRDRLYDYNDYV